MGDENLNTRPTNINSFVPHPTLLAPFPFGRRPWNMPGSYAESINTVYSTPAEYEAHEGEDAQLLSPTLNDFHFHIHHTLAFTVRKGRLGAQNPHRHSRLHTKPQTR